MQSKAKKMKKRKRKHKTENEKEMKWIETRAKNLHTITHHLHKNIAQSKCNRSKNIKSCDSGGGDDGNNTGIVNSGWLAGDL